MCPSKPVIKPTITVNDSDVARRKQNQDTLRNRKNIGAGADLLLEPLAAPSSLFKAKAAGV